MALLGLVFLSLFTWLASILIFRIFFHPLAQYPGPLLAKLTGWYGISHVIRGENHLHLHHLHELYGPVVRIGPNRLSYNTKEAVRDIYADRKANTKKSGFVEALVFLQGGARNLQSIQDRQAYSQRRRLIAHAFSEEALRSSEHYILEQIRQWCSALGSKAVEAKTWTSTIDMKEWAHYLKEDILGELCFGQSFGAVQAGSSDFEQLVTESVKSASILSWLPLGKRFLQLLGFVIDKARIERWTFIQPMLNYEADIENKISKRLAMNTQRKDFVHYILQAKDAETGETITPIQMRNECDVLFGAGVDTAATTIAACLFYLTLYPAVLEKLNEEIRTTFADVEEITQGRKLQALSYLRACIDEALRLAPPVPGPLLREVLPGGLVINGKTLPAGTEVCVPMYAIHHNEIYFPEPSTFRPERWLDKSKDANRDAFVPFSAGTRVCIGRNLAYLDMTLSLARLLFLFDIRAAPEDNTEQGSVAKSRLTERRNANQMEYHVEDWFVTVREGPFLQLKARS